MASYYGKYVAFINSIANNQLDFARERMPSALIQVYQDVFKPHLSELFPRMKAPSIQGQVIGAKKQFSIPYRADMGMMAPFVDRLDELDEYTVGYDQVHYQTRLTGFAGPTLDPMEFKNEFVDGFLDDRNQAEISEVMLAFKRREEMELVQFAFGDTTSISYFSPDLSTVALKRLLRLDAISGKCTTYGMSDGSAVLKGKLWSDGTDGDPIYDISTIVWKMSDFMGVDNGITGFVGSKTAWVLDNSTKLTNAQAYHINPVNTIMGQSIKGVTLKRVSGQYYKDDATLNTSRLHNPGLGNIQPDTWPSRVKVPMMRHVADTRSDPFAALDNTTATYEWALFHTGGPVGSTSYARVFEDHADPTVPFIHSYKDEKSRSQKVNLYEAFTPTVTDFGKMVVIERLTAV